MTDRLQWVSAEDALVRRLIVELGFDPAPVESADIMEALEVRGGSVREAVLALIMGFGEGEAKRKLRRCCPVSGDEVLCVACAEPIVSNNDWMLWDGRVPLHASCWQSVSELIAN